LDRCAHVRPVVRVDLLEERSVRHVDRLPSICTIVVAQGRVSTHRTGDRDRGDDECARSGAVLSEAERRPDQQRKEHVRAPPVAPEEDRAAQREERRGDRETFELLRPPCE
jgi:hypothetical protein